MRLKFCRKITPGLFLMLCNLACFHAQAFWLLGFSNAFILPRHSVSFIGGTGGQFTDVGKPGSLSFTPFLAHAGIRVGVSKRIDWGYRLCTVAIPYSTVGPSLGAASDFKLRVTPDSSSWQVSVVAGGAFSYLALKDQSRNAWSPGAAVIISHALGKGVILSINGRYVYTGIMDAPGGEKNNNLTAIGGSINVGFRLNQSVMMIPEVGIFKFNGMIYGNTLNGIGLQYGMILACRIN